MAIGIVGLPQSGKTTLFNLLTGAHGDTGAYHGGQVAVGVVRVPDGRLDALAQVFEPEEIVPATLQFEDIGGVFAHLTGGEPSGAAMAALRDTDAVVMVLRGFESPYVAEIFGEVDPAREYRAMSEELLLADLAVIEKRLENIEAEVQRAGADREALQAERDLLERCRAAVEQEHGLRAVEMNALEEKRLRNYAFLTLKPRVCVLNIDEERIGAPADHAGLNAVEPPPLRIAAEFELELNELELEDRAAFMDDAGLEEPASGRLVCACSDALGLRTFFTYVSEQLHAWTVRAGATAPEAAGKIHSDIQEGFIRAEVVGCEELLELGGLKEAKSAGRLRMEGKDYEVQDGDVITFHFSR